MKLYMLLSAAVREGSIEKKNHSHIKLIQCLNCCHTHTVQTAGPQADWITIEHIPHLFLHGLSKTFKITASFFIFFYFGKAKKFLRASEKWLNVASRVRPDLPAPSEYDGWVHVNRILRSTLTWNDEQISTKSSRYSYTASQTLLIV